MFYIKVCEFIYSRAFRVFFKPYFRDFGRNSSVIFPLKISGMKNISVGNSVYIAKNAWLTAMQLDQDNACELKIGDGTCIGHYSHIYATNSIVIGKDVLVADKVYISDNLHTYDDISIPILKQPVKQISSVVIGDGSWLGENVCIIGAKIGRNCVIGANSIVTRDVPDYSVAVGNPARVIKQYSFENNAWIKL